MATTFPTKPSRQTLKGREPALRALAWPAPIRWQVWLALLLALALLLSVARPALAQEPAPADGDVPADWESQAEEPLRILQLRLHVLPEYDDPRVLVIGQGRLAGGPADGLRQVSFWVPQGAQVNLISGMTSAEAELVSQPFTLQADPQRPGWALLTSEFDSAHFFYEYYYDGLESDPADASRKGVAFTFTSPLPVERLSLEILQPRGASDFTSDPPATATRQDARSGFNYHQVESGPLAAGQELALQVHYTKADPALSVIRPEPAAASAEEAAAGSAARAASTTGAGIAPDWMASGELPPWLALLLGGVTAATVVGVAGRRLGGASHRSAQQRRQETAPAAPGCACPVCGRPQLEGAFYCHRCGSLLARELMPETETGSVARGWSPAGKEGR